MQNNPQRLYDYLYKTFSRKQNYGYREPSVISRGVGWVLGLIIRDMRELLRGIEIFCILIVVVYTAVYFGQNSWNYTPTKREFYCL